MKLISMKQSKGGDEMSGPAERDDYPYGLSISLDNDSLKKLGVDALPEVGQEMMIMAKVKVRSVSEYASEGSNERSVSLQITDMAFHEGSNERDRDRSKDAETLYPEE